jgi:hypothetical protein
MDSNESKSEQVEQCMDLEHCLHCLHWLYLAHSPPTADRATFLLAAVFRLRSR